MENNLICPGCQNYFDSLSNKPLLIPECGHTVCQPCIKSKLYQCGEEQTFTCPKDNMPIISIKRDIASFPKNIGILRQLEKSDSIKNLDRNSSVGRGSLKLDANSSLMNSSDFQSSNNIFGGGYEEKDNFKNCPTPNLFSSFGETDICSEHQKKYEILWP